MLNHAQGFDQCPFINAYKRIEDVFLKISKPVLKNDVPDEANIIKSHTMYREKPYDDVKRKMKAQIAPYSNDDDLKNMMTKD